MKSEKVEDLATELHAMMYEQFDCDQHSTQGQYCKEGVHVFYAIHELLKKRIPVNTTKERD